MLVESWGPRAASRLCPGLAISERVIKDSCGSQTVTQWTTCKIKLKNGEAETNCTYIMVTMRKTPYALQKVHWHYEPAYKQIYKKKNRSLFGLVCL